MDSELYTREIKQGLDKKWVIQIWTCQSCPTARNRCPIRPIWRKRPRTGSGRSDRQYDWSQRIASRGRRREWSRPWSLIITYNHTQNQTLKDVNLVADADVIKNLIKLGQSSEYTSLMIHKVGSTLFLDDFDIKTELLDKQSASHHWFKSILTNILCKGQNYSQVEAEFLSCISRLSGPELRSILSLESKFLYHSLPQILPTIETVRPAECQESDCYLQNNLWRFRAGPYVLAVQGETGWCRQIVWFVVPVWEEARA